MKIIFDLDHTLLSTGKFYRFFESSFAKLGIPRESFRAAFQEAKDKDQNYRSGWHFRILARGNPSISVKTMQREFGRVLGRLDGFSYPDVFRTLKKLKGKAELILISYGNKRFQRDKINHLKIKKEFKRIFVTGDIDKIGPLKRIMKTGEKTFFVDDNPAALSTIKRKFPGIVTVRINRGEGRYRETRNGRNIDFSVKNLKELEKIFNRI